MREFATRFDQPCAAKGLANHLTGILDQIAGNPSTDDIIFVCVGTDRVTGDALGPIVGSHLKDLGVPNVYGTLEETVHATNLLETIYTIDREHPDSFVIAIDALLSAHKRVGTIVCRLGALRPGRAVGRNLPRVGNIHIMGVVGEPFGRDALGDIRLYTVMRVGAVMARGIANAILRKGRPYEGEVEEACGYCD